MQEDEQTGAAGRDRGGGAVAIRNVSESIYPGREPVIVRTTRLPAPEPDEQPPRDGSAARESDTAGLTG
jgi:hypothetical protein